MITLKDYAKSNGISYEAVRKQVVRYKKDLGEHVVKVNRTQFLDEHAVEFLQAKRQESPIIIQQADRSEELNRLMEENKALLIKIATLQEELLHEKDQVKLLQSEKISLLEEKKKPGLLSWLFGKA